MREKGENLPKRYKKRKTRLNKINGLENALSRRQARNRAKMSDLEAKSKATGKTVAQLIVESWEDAP
jgi:hypothetical protein